MATAALRTIVAQVVGTVLVSTLAIQCAGGSRSTLALQIAAAVVGGFVAVAAGRWGRSPGLGAARVLLGVTFAVEVYVLLVGVPMEGVRRWIALGPIQLHPASLLVPLAAWIAARRLDGIAAALLAGLFLVLAAQPDAASVLALTLGVAIGMITTRETRRGVAALALLGVACSAYAFTRHDPLPAVAHVERVIVNAFAVSPSVGILAALAMAVLPLAMVWRRRSPETLALACVWTGFALANLLGNYPAPVIGAGASPMLGWLLSIGLAYVARDKADLRADARDRNG
ncbi:FtsW/RodA/SpoVE family cell cycle protein [Caulobacter segnis]|uniref:FtsW/RodA/SpoVE family cell cycle protein n=1 Tax=Caulobacter segnis TaxID=88688 RepID=UPI001CBCAF01|nr:FtsW/RodA/SpoVE family cell cycle protein [Caulobacter segnis]UAL11323.1 FtsW/RodA/SpoVE family cell cycle protein [Caulobacter segnis]